MVDLTNDEFALFQKLTHGLVGIKLPESKRALVVSRLSSRIRDLQLESFMDYLRYINTSANGEREIITFINKITTNETFFFRENVHFDYLKDQLIPQILKRHEKASSVSLRIWSSACSSGEEPYSIAMTVLQAAQKYNKKIDVKILASDISTRVLGVAEKGIYFKKDIESKLPDKSLWQYFDSISNDEVQVKKQVRDLVTFKRVNLLDERYPIKKDLDIIFCRNVMIYFDDEVKNHILGNFYSVLSNSGNLFIGHSENLFSTAHLFKLIRNTIYTKVVS